MELAKWKGWDVAWRHSAARLPPGLWYNGLAGIWGGGAKHTSAYVLTLPLLRNPGPVHLPEPLFGVCKMGVHFTCPYTRLIHWIALKWDETMCFLIIFFF